MIFALSTRWNAGRHRSGEEMLEEILKAGFDRVELGYDLRTELVPGVRRMASEKAVTVTSVHNFCPVPVGAPQGHPELFQLASMDRRTRDSAVRHTVRTLEFAGEVGAKAMVVHAGNVEIRNRTRKLIALSDSGLQHSPRYARIREKLLLKRAKKGPAHLEHLYRAIEDLAPSAEAAGVCIAFENLPSWESIPTEAEMEALGQHFNSPWVGCWHDFGHGQVRDNLGFISHLHWLERLKPWLKGMHVHDVAPPAHDHLMPPDGRIDFSLFRGCLKPGIPLVIEPSPGTPIERIQEAARILGKAWALDAEPSASHVL